MKRLVLIIGTLIVFSAMGRSAETTITGNTMELVDKGESVLFKGKVRLERGTDIIKADWMQTSKYKDKVNARGQVELYRSMVDGDKIKAFGEEAFYNAKIGDGTIFGKKKLSHMIYHRVVSSTSTQVLDMFATRFDFSESSSTGTATGNVYGKSVDAGAGSQYEFWSDLADMNQAEKKIYLTGTAQPKVRQINLEGDRIIEGDSIVYSYDLKRFEARGRAKAVFTDLNPEKK